jgi:hypothetical protein
MSRFFQQAKNRTLVAVISSAILLILSIRFGLFNHEDAYERALTYNLFTGELMLQDRAGWNTHAPWTLVTSIDLRPMRVCVTSSAQAALNCKLVRFKVSEYRKFVETEGFRYYWWANRLSFNSGHKKTYRGFEDVVRGYAYSLERYPFIEEAPLQ